MVYLPRKFTVDQLLIMLSIHFAIANNVTSYVLSTLQQWGRCRFSCL